MASELQQYERIVTTYAAQQASIAAELLRLLLGLWLPFTWWGRPDMVNAAAAQSAVYVDIATKRARRLSRAHMLAQLRLIGAEPDRLPPIEDTYERGGTSIVDVYKRPARQIEHMIREAQKALDTLEAPARPPIELPDRITDEMMRTFEERMTSLVEDDVAATARDEAQKVLWAAPKVVGYRRVIHPEFSETGTCGLCVVASSKFYTKGELMPLHANCFPAWVPVTSPTGVRSAQSRPYDGILVDVETASGRSFSVTPNHPVLTPDGWVDAGSLVKGMHLIRYNGEAERLGGGSPDDQDAVLPIGEVFEALRQRAGVIARRMPVAAEDFHGDGIANSDVEVVWPDGLLRLDGEPFSTDRFSESKLFLSGHREVPFTSERDDSLTFLCKRHAARSFMRPRCEFPPARLTEAIVTDRGGFRHGSAVYPGVAKPAVDHVPGDTVGASEFLDAVASLVEREEVVSVRTRQWSGHVYNLQTGGGWFTASGFIVHNCKCTIAPITANQDLGLRLNRADLDRLYEAAGSNYAEDLKRITVQVREHGELGPILTQRGTKFRDVKTVNKTSKRHKFTPYERMTPEAQQRMWTAMRDTSERSIRILEDARDAGTNLVDIAGTGVKVPVRDIEQAIQYHRSLIARALGNLA